MIVLHDYIEQTDGGSRLCVTLAEGLGCPLLCGFARRGHPFLAERPGLELAELMRDVPLPLLRQWRLALAFRGCTSAIAGQDTVVYSGSYAPLAVRKRRGLANVLYCHTPPRFLYDEQERFAQMLPAPARPLLRAFCAWLKPQYEAAVAGMSVILANSRTVQKRIRNTLGFDSRVVAPPCSVGSYRWAPAANYYLSFVRLDALKRVDLVIKAFRDMPHTRLVVASDGPEAPVLRQLAQGAWNIRFVGVLDETRLRDALAGCIASIFVSRDEDFGMSAVESLASGKPVIAAGAGGLAEIVTHGVTGLMLAADPCPGDIADAVRHLDIAHGKCMRHACEEAARRYDTPVFLAAMREAIAEARRGAA